MPTTYFAHLLIIKLGLSSTQSAHIHASLFNFNLPLEFASTWAPQKGIFDYKPKSLSIPVVPTREFCIALFKSKIEATIRNRGDKTESEYDNHPVGPVAAAAKQSFLRLIPHIMPPDSDHTSLYRLVLDHRDFGIHNMSIRVDVKGQPLVASLYDLGDWVRRAGYLVRSTDCGCRRSCDR